MEYSRTLKEHRLHRNLSQSELSIKSGISIRTIQRIENGESNGSPYVIRTLCQALEINSDNLMLNRNTDSEKSLFSNDELTNDVLPVEDVYDKRLKYLNFSALSILLFPFTNLLTTVITYFIFKKSLNSSLTKEASLKILDLQILWSLLTLLIIIVIPVIDYIFFGIEQFLEIPLFIWGYMVMVVTLVILIFVTAIQINKKENVLSFIPNIL